MLEKSFFYQEILHKGREEGRIQERLLSIELVLTQVASTLRRK
ncbi:hypothetical protein [Dolichospermum sp. UHCC 0259]|nr:hypothetical protein [Dolichospermum sp. UHCC 0259]